MPWRCTECLREDDKIHDSTTARNMREHLGAPGNHNYGPLVCRVADCPQRSHRTDRNRSHSEPTAHQADWHENQGLVDDLTTEIEDCRRAHRANATTAAALLAALAQGPGPGAPAAAGNAAPTAGNLPGLPTAGHVAHSGPALQSTNNTAPVAPVPGAAATGFTTAGAQGQNNPLGTGQDQTHPPGAEQDQAAQPNDGDDAVGEQEEEQEQGGQPTFNDEDDTAEEQENDQEQDDETNVIDEDDNGSEQGAQYEQDDQPGANVEDNAVEEQEEDQEQDEQSTGTNNPAALVLGPTASTAPADIAGTQGQTNSSGTGQGQVDQPIVIDEYGHGTEQDTEYDEEFDINVSPLRPDERDRFLNARFEREQSLVYQPVNPHFDAGSSAHQDARDVEANFLSRADFGEEYQ